VKKRAIMVNASESIGNKRIDDLQERIRGLKLSAEEIGNKVPSDEAFIMSIKSEINHAKSLIEFYRLLKN
jgi:hypothetical protein